MANKFILLPPLKRSTELLSSLLSLWETSVRASHFFLSEADIQALIPLVRGTIQQIPILVVAMENDQPVGFMGIEGEKLEMLFVLPEYFGKGIGKELVRCALDQYGVTKVDVNEQNPHAAEFYRRMGFRLSHRSELDEQGNPFPILHLDGGSRTNGSALHTSDNKKIDNLYTIPQKPHYPILDGLRGVAALMVVWFHIFEAFATSHVDQQINHGYLAVDFFFILSGFVIGYAYDDRWKKMSIKEFIKRRVIRLHPMVVMGALIGAVMFYFQGCSFWDVSKVSVSMLLIATLLNLFLIPATPGSEIRGVTEMYPLNGPSWSLFYEYIGNILYALFIRKLPTKALAALVLLAGGGLAVFAIRGPLGDICAGFSLNRDNIIGGSLRLLFSFSAGLLLFRLFKPTQINGAFWKCSLAVIILLAVPRIGGETHFWMNGLYDTVCFAALFPLIVYLGASGKATGLATTKICKMLGDLSYPLYMVHYPFIYLYFAWVKNENLSFTQSLPGALALFFGCILLAYLCLKLYDEPVRKFLARRTK